MVSSSLAWRGTVKLRRHTVAVLFVLACLLATGDRVSAQAPGYDSTDGCDGSWQQQFGVNLLILDCQPGYATEHDRAYMFARQPVDTGADWRTQLDFTDAVWLFDAGAKGKASLIVDFHRDGPALVADFYDDVSGDGELRYGLERGYPRSVESRFPTVRVTAPDGWWVRDGRVNYNLRLAVDGPVEAAFGSFVFAYYLQTDGRPDIISEVHDTSGEGRPRWQIIQAQPPLGERDAFYRTLLMVNEADDELPVDTYILWPHLGYSGGRQPTPPPPIRPPLSSLAGASFGLAKNYNASHPPIQVDWATGRIRFIGEFVASRGRAHNWFVYSNYRFGVEGKTLANFENPFAFYDLAGANDGYPDLSIRQQFTAKDDIFSSSLVRGPAQEIRYSWDQDHRRRWSYKVNLGGRHPMPSTVQVGGDVRLETVPYRELPGWVVGNTWEVASLVAVERDSYWTTEGIYEWCVICTEEMDAYSAGATDRKPTQFFSSIAMGLRGDYTTRLGEPVRLYLSAVDRKLHLYRAEGGVWEVREGEKLRYGNLGGDFLNRWERYVDGTLVESLTHLSDRLILTDPDGVRIARAPEAPALFIANPPSDHASWQSLRDQLALANKAGVGHDLVAIFDRLAAERLDLPGLLAWDVRPVENGFRMLLRVPEGAPPREVDWARDLGPGTYVLSYRPVDGFAVRPAEPPRLALSAPELRGDAPTEQAPARVAAILRNDGDEDTVGVPLVFMARRADDVSEVVGSAVVDVPAGGTRVAEILWLPGSAGDWAVHVAALGAGSTVSPPLRVKAGAAPPTDVGSMLLAQGLRPFSGGAISASITLVVAVSVGLGFVLWRASPRPRGTTDG